MTTSDHMNRTLDFVHHKLGLRPLSDDEKQICRLQAAAIEALGEIEQGKANDAHKTLSDALREAA